MFDLALNVNEHPDKYLNPEFSCSTCHCSHDLCHASSAGGFNVVADRTTCLWLDNTKGYDMDEESSF